MSETNADQGDVISGGITNDQQKQSVVMSIRSLVKDRLVNSHEVVKEAIIEKRKHKEIERRTEAVTKVLEQLEAAETDRQKIRPIPAGFDEKGKPVGVPMFTKEQVKSLKDNEELTNKLSRALEMALIQGDYSKVFELGNK